MTLQLKMNPGEIIGFAGYIGSGKTTLAKQIEAASRGLVVRLAFADPFKNILSAVLIEMGIDNADARYRMLRGDLKDLPVPGYPFSPRHMMQTLGTEWGRKCLHPNIWVDLTMARARRLLATGYGVIIDDVRFEAEGAAIRELGGKVIHINNPRVGRTSDHLSEDLPTVDEVLTNDWETS